MRLPALILMLTLAAACVNETPSSGPGAVGGDPAEDTTTSLGRIGLEQVSLEFSGCMREHGVAIPDLRLDAAARPVLADLAAAVDTTSSEFQTALVFCAPILTTAGALDLRSDPELRAAIVEDLEAFSECARSRGLSDFPDPDPGFDGTGPAYPVDAVPTSDPAYQQVVELCQAELAGSG